MNPFSKETDMVAVCLVAWFIVLGIVVVYLHVR